MDLKAHDDVHYYVVRNELYFYCPNCGRNFIEDRLDMKTLNALDNGEIQPKESMFPDDDRVYRYNIRYLIRYGVCWKCKKNPELMRMEKEINDREAKRRSRERFQRWIDSMD